MAKIQYTQEELTFKASIQVGDVGAVNIKRTQPPRHKDGALKGQIMTDVNGKEVEQFSVEIAEKLDGVSGESVNLLEMANPLNPVFKRGGGLRNAWQTVSKEWAAKVFGCDIAALDALPIHDNTNQARVYIGQLNPGFDMNGFTTKFASEFKNDSYEIKNLKGERGNTATAKRAGATGRWIMGLNPLTGQVEHIIERGVVNTDKVSKDGEIIRSWEHQTIAEHDATTDGIPHQLNTATGTVEVANAPLPAL